MSTTYESTSESGVGKVDGVGLLPVPHEKTAESRTLGDAMASGSGGGSEAFDEVTGNLKQFALFPKLPPELRDHIWKCTLEPRLVIVFAGSEYSAWYPQLWGSNTQTPAIFSVCSGSRKVALQEHKWLSKDASHQKIYFVPSLDTVYFKGQFDRGFDGVSEFCGEAGSDIQLLAIEHEWQRSPVYVLEKRGLNFSRHKDLKELILVRKYHMDVYSHYIGTGRIVDSLGDHVYRIDGLRSITVEEEFDDDEPMMLKEGSRDHMDSEYVQEKITDYLQNQENSFPDIRRDVGSPNGPLPKVKVLIEVVEEPNDWSLSVEARKRAEEEAADANKDLSSLGIFERMLGRSLMDAEISDEEEEEVEDVAGGFVRGCVLMRGYIPRRFT